jgi:hypothetical protein
MLIRKVEVSILQMACQRMPMYRHYRDERSWHVHECTIARSVREPPADRSDSSTCVTNAVADCWIDTPCATMIDEWMNEYEHMVTTRVKGKHYRIFNYDETGFQLMEHNTWVMVTKEEHRKQRRAECKKEKVPALQHLSASVCISAAGKLVPIMWITTGKTSRSLKKFGSGPQGGYMAATSE